MTPIPLASPVPPDRSQPWLLYAVVLLACVPLFVVMPVHEDTSYYSIQARNVLSGGVLYRDMFEPNLPGVVWIHMGIRQFAGDSWVAIRCADLLIFGAIAWLLTRLFRLMGLPPLTIAFAVAVLFLYYCSLWQGCHCQRDLWMLLPSLIALLIRQSQVIASLAPTIARPWRDLRQSMLEGGTWAIAFWIKPHVIVPALAVVFLSWLIVRRPRWMFMDAAGLLLAGTVMGAVGSAWLIRVNAWESFWDTMRNWNPEYVQIASQSIPLSRRLFLVTRLFPWSLVHLVAIPVASVRIYSFLRNVHLQHGPTVRSSVTGVLLSTMYLGWLLQLKCLQHYHDYVQLPAIILGMATFVVGQESSRAIRWLLWTFVSVSLIASLSVIVPMLSYWPACFFPDQLPSLRNRVARVKVPNWEDFEKVTEFLRENQVADGDLHCYHHLFFYDQLGVNPPIRYTYLPFMLQSFPSRRDEILGVLNQSGHRLIVSDLAAEGLDESLLESTEDARGWKLSSDFPESRRRSYPWKYPILFRSGTILVHRIERP